MNKISKRFFFIFLTFIFIFFKKINKKKNIFLFKKIIFCNIKKIYILKIIINKI
ncbi:hypothetical protein [Candidatus Carsonella ruddii]|uniref:Putative F0F1-type ATP synthase delta subunit n=1 Tax=Candidatus Carsonella ruddii HC isolate Thao2000 TaxID=1202538 RepID=J3VPQ2_CARRU|nr:hypothetical protein [Candidatus Carsonella ruddii]AFP83861.1 putative F0F1-type ATP synthase delta subunit [Candidatus Carsonella ruddii HC isolate Thao2000]